jgi:hypothetical protein
MCVRQNAPPINPRARSTVREFPYLYCFRFRNSSCLNQLVRNNPAIRKAGNAITRIQTSLIAAGTGRDIETTHVTYKIPAAPKSAAPIHSQRHAKTKAAISTMEGIRCMNSANAVCQKPRFSAKTSKAKRLRKAIKAIDSTRGVQNSNCLEKIDMLPPSPRFGN